MLNIELRGLVAHRGPWPWLLAVLHAHSTPLWVGLSIGGVWCLAEVPPKTPSVSVSVREMPLGSGIQKGGWVIKQPGGRRDPNGPCLVSYLAWSSTWPTPPPSSRGPGMQTSNADRRIWVWSTEQDPEEGRSGQGQECQGGPGVAWSA